MSAEASLEPRLSHKNNSRRRLLSEYLSRRRYFIIMQAFYRCIGMLKT